MTSRGEAGCHQLRDRTVTKLSKALLFPHIWVRTGVLPLPARAPEQSKQFQGHQWHPQYRGQLSRDCTVPSPAMVGTGETPIPTLLWGYRQAACDDKGSLATQDESLSRCGIQHSLAASSDLQNGLKRHFTPHLGMENRPGKNLKKGIFRRGSAASRGSAVLVQHSSLAEAAVHMVRSALRHPRQHTPPQPHADTGIPDKSRAMASPESQVQADRAPCSSCPGPAEALARGLWGCKRQNRPSVQMGKMLR